MIVSHVLRDDPDLWDALPAATREQAAEECVVATVRVARGPWRAQGLPPIVDGIGLLVLEGLLLRRVGVDARFGTELLGESDLLRPWQGEDSISALSPTTGWRVLEPLRLAVLDSAAAEQLAAYPALTGRLVGRALQRSRNLAVNMAIVHHARVTVRVQMLLWHLADRWGRVRSDGVILPLQLTHTVLADLVAARRPTVTTALSELGQSGVVTLTQAGWLLRGDPPGELLELEELALTRRRATPGSAI